MSLRLDYPEFIYQDILPELQISFDPVTNLSEYLMQNNRALKEIDIDIKLKKIDTAHFKNQLNQILIYTSKLHIKRKKEIP